MSLKSNSAKASQSYGAVERAEKARQEIIDKLMQRVEITPERVQSFLSRVKAAATRGETEMMVMRFPSALCADRGRALNNSEPEWPDTLVGQPRQFYENLERKARARRLSPEGDDRRVAERISGRRRSVRRLEIVVPHQVEQDEQRKGKAIKKKKTGDRSLKPTAADRSK